MAFLPSPHLAQFLVSPSGTKWLAEAANLALTPQTLIADLQGLRTSLTPGQAAAVVEQILLRRKGLTKFDRAEAMLFVREALEQATHSQVAQYRAARFQGAGLVGDLGCGIGGDSLALASVASRVLSYDLDEVRLIFARHNALVYNLAGEIDFIQTDIRRLPGWPGQLEAIFADPARRTGRGKRVTNPRHYHPPLDKLMETYAQQPFGIKVAPHLDFSTVPLVDEIEVISLQGEVREAVLWFNALATPGVFRRATLLPSGDTLTDATSDPCLVGPLGAYLYEPDPAVIRAGLVRQLGAHLNLTLLDQAIAYLSGDAMIQSPFVKPHRIERRLPLKIKQINRYLKEHQISRLNIKQRGTGLAPDKVARQLKLVKEGVERTLVLMRIADDHLALICERL